MRADSREFVLSIHRWFCSFYCDIKNNLRNKCLSTFIYSTETNIAFKSCDIYIYTYNFGISNNGCEGNLSATMKQVDHGGPTYIAHLS